MPLRSAILTTPKDAPRLAGFGKLTIIHSWVHSFEVARCRAWRVMKLACEIPASVIIVQKM